MDADGAVGDGVLKIYFMYLYLSCTIIIKLSSKPEFVHTYFLLFNPLHLRQFDHTLVVDSNDKL